ncbi:MAG: hypothetical protein GVY02_04495, partial [Bacteroidetes bacterium]|nr:hypothetical protein [Bacteroidota bacterium]
MSSKFEADETILILTDTHCHLYLEQFEDDLAEVLNRSVQNGVTRIFLPAIDWASIEKMDTLS